MFPARSAEPKLEVTRARIRIGSFHCASELARIMRRGLFTVAVNTIPRCAQHIDLAAVPVYHRAERRAPELSGAVILDLDPAERVVAGTEVLRLDVRNAIRCAADLDARGQILGDA